MLFGEVNQAAVDWPWSVIHVGSGVAIGLVLISVMRAPGYRQFWLAGMGLLILWELVEVSLRLLDMHAHEFIRPLKQAVHGFAFDQESPGNILGDLVVGGLGLWVGGAAGRALRRS